MTSFSEEKVNACSPGFGASCALCCGSHNFAASVDQMEKIFRLRSEAAAPYSREYLVKKAAASRSSMTGSYPLMTALPEGYADPPPLFRGDVCGLMGFQSPDSKLLGCPLHDSRDASLGLDCHRNYWNKNFTCRAREELLPREILFAAALFRDWYYYSMLIYSIDLLENLAGGYVTPEEVPESRISDLKGVLDELRKRDEAMHSLSSYF